MGRKLRENLKKLMREEDGITTVEIILILVVLLALVVIFREQLTGLLSGIFEHIGSSVQDLY